MIQLKRFDFDWTTERPIKFNDLFEFPRTLDMTPYTAAALARVVHLLNLFVEIRNACVINCRKVRRSKVTTRMMNSVISTNYAVL